MAQGINLVTGGIKTIFPNGLNGGTPDGFTIASGAFNIIGGIAVLTSLFFNSYTNAQTYPFIAFVLSQPSEIVGLIIAFIKTTKYTGKLSSAVSQEINWSGKFSMVTFYSINNTSTMGFGEKLWSPNGKYYLELTQNKDNFVTVNLNALDTAIKSWISTVKYDSKDTWALALFYDSDSEGVLLRIWNKTAARVQPIVFANQTIGSYLNDPNYNKICCLYQIQEH